MRTPSLGVLALLSLSGLFLSGRPASAELETPPRAAVPFGDLDLATRAGADTLRLRIDHAVTSISGGDQPVTGSILPRADLQEARARGRAQADALIATAREGCDRRS